MTAHLAGLGLPVFGVDLSPQMVALARRTHPQVRFEVGAMSGLELPDGALGGIVAWYSIIHTPQERLPELCAAFRRLLAPGGMLLLAFQVGDEPLHVAQPFGHPVALDFRRRRPDRIAGLLTAAGLEVRTRMLREPDEELGSPPRRPFSWPANRPAAEAPPRMPRARRPPVPLSTVPAAVRGTRPCQACGWWYRQPSQAEVIMSRTSCRAFQPSSSAIRSADATTRAGSPARRGVTSAVTS